MSADRGKRAMVTGATGGIGSVFAGRLARDGWALTLVARDRERLEELAGGLAGTGHEIVAADLADPAGLAAVASRLRERRHNLLVNNAGFGLYGEFTEIPVERQRQMIGLNCDALTVVAHAFLQQAEQGDALLNTASTLGLAAFPTGAAYSATKAYVIAFSEALWYEQRPRGVHVLALCPGVTRTDFHARAGGGAANPFPAYMAQSPEQVVDYALRKLRRRGAPTKISGLMNRLIVGSGRLLPRSTVTRIMGGFAVKAS